MRAEPCADCGTRGGSAGARRVRGLCCRCYQRARTGGVLKVRPNQRWSDVLEEMEFLGFDDRLPVHPQLRNLAPRLGMTLNALERGWERHKARQREEVAS